MSDFSEDTSLGGSTAFSEAERKPEDLTFYANLRGHRDLGRNWRYNEEYASNDGWVGTTDGGFDDPCDDWNVGGCAGSKEGAAAAAHDEPTNCNIVRVYPKNVFGCKWVYHVCVKC